MYGNIALDKDLRISDFDIQRMDSDCRAERLLDGIEEVSSRPIIRTASGNVQENLITLFTQMLSCLNLKSNADVEAFIKGVSSGVQGVQGVQGDQLNKSAAMVKTQGKHDEIKIASKDLKDSHYHIDISRDSIEKHGRKLIMVSCFAKDDYLGRYLVKRNYFFRPDREAAANEAYDEIKTKMNALKDRYYSEISDISVISTQMRKILDGVISEVEFKDVSTER